MQELGRLVEVSDMSVEGLGRVEKLHVSTAYCMLLLVRDD